MCEFDDGPVGSGATATVVGERALGRLANRSRGLQGQTLSLGESHTRAILVDFSNPDSGIKTRFWAHDSFIGTNRKKLNPR